MFNKLKYKVLVTIRVQDIYSGSELEAIFMEHEKFDSTTREQENQDNIRDVAIHSSVPVSPVPARTASGCI